MLLLLLLLLLNEYFISCFFDVKFLKKKLGSVYSNLQKTLLANQILIIAAVLRISNKISKFLTEVLKNQKMRYFSMSLNSSLPDLFFLLINVKKHLN